MDNNKLLMTILLAAATTLPALAQTNGDETREKTRWENNWYVEAGGGAQILFSKNAGLLDAGDRFTPAVSLTVGRWFSPYWGVRVQAQGYQMNGLAVADGSNWGDPVRDHVSVLPNGNYPYYTRYMNIHADAQVSLANLIGGYDPDRRWDVMPALGIGYVHAFPYKGSCKRNTYAGMLSVMAKWRLPKGVDLNLEVGGAIMPDDFDGRNVGYPDGNIGATLGLTYNIPKLLPRQKKARKARATTQATMLWDEDQLRSIIREELERSGNTAAPDTVYVVKETAAQPTVNEEANATANVPFTLSTILFKLGADKPKDGQEMAFVNIARYMETYPDARIRLDGYADSSTGSERVNLYLSMRRAVNVRDILVNDYGIDSSRIEAQGIGTNAQPYEENDWNRVVIVTVIK